MTITPKEAKQNLIAQGQSIAGWARENGFSVPSVRAVLAGHNKGNFGESHKVAVALGLKVPPE